MARARRSNSELSRAARNLILAHGARAAGVAELRARRLDECGEDEVARTWRQIGVFVRAIEAGASPAARNKVAPFRQSDVSRSASAIPAARTASGGPLRAHAEATCAPEMPCKEYKAGDIIHETSDLEHWVGGKPNDFARLIDSVASK